MGEEAIRKVSSWVSWVWVRTATEKSLQFVYRFFTVFLRDVFAIGDPPSL